MGADLYRQNRAGKNAGKKVPILGFERSARAIEVGYFRDAYNSGSILAQFGLSWWRDIIPLCDDNGVLTPEKVREFRSMVEAKRAQFEANMNLGVNIDGEPISAEWVADFREGAALLLKYLDDAIADNDGIEASL